MSLALRLCSARSRARLWTWGCGNVRARSSRGCIWFGFMALRLSSRIFSTPTALVLVPVSAPGQQCRKRVVSSWLVWEVFASSFTARVVVAVIGLVSSAHKGAWREAASFGVIASMRKVREYQPALVAGKSAASICKSVSSSWSRSIRPSSIQVFSVRDQPIVPAGRVAELSHLARDRPWLPSWASMSHTSFWRRCLSARISGICRAGVRPIRAVW